MQIFYISLLSAYICTLLYYSVSYNLERIKVNKKAEIITDVIMSILSLYFYFIDITEKDMEICEKYIERTLRTYGLFDELVNCSLVKTNDKTLQATFSIKNSSVFNQRTIEFQKTETQKTIQEEIEE